MTFCYLFLCVYFLLYLLYYDTLFKSYSVCLFFYVCICMSPLKPHKKSNENEMVKLHKHFSFFIYIINNQYIKSGEIFKLVFTRICKVASQSSKQFIYYIIEIQKLCLEVLENAEIKIYCIWWTKCKCNIFSCHFYLCCSFLMPAFFYFIILWIELFMNFIQS